MQSKLENRINAMNQVHEYINKVAPVLREYVAKNGYTYKAGTNELFKKDKTALEAFLKDAPEGIQTWFNCSLYSGVSLQVKTCYAESGDLTKQGYWGAAYYERSAYLGKPDGTQDVPSFEAFPIYDLAEWQEKAALIEPLRDKIREMESELRAITYVTEGK